jgi:hypothetical protein
VRGYVWDEKILPLATTPAELARLVMARSTTANFEEYRQQSAAIARLHPSVDAIASQMREFLSNV